MTDQNGLSVNAETSINVEVEYGFLQDNFLPNPSWDLVENVVVGSRDDSNADISLNVSSGVGGSTTTLIADNNTELYNPDSNLLRFLDPNITTEQIEAAIAGSTPEPNITVVGTGSTGFPVVAKIRGQEVYIVFGFTGTTTTSIGYKKTSEFAGR
jgi:hypothetical protein